MDDKQKQIDRHIKGTVKQFKKENLRNARRKTGFKTQGKKPRQKKISPTALERWDDLDDLVFDTIEPIMSKDTREHRRGIAKQARVVANQCELHPMVNSNGSNANADHKTFQGLVIEAASGVCRVDLDGDILFCEIRGSVKDVITDYINPVAVGDQVLIHKNGTERGVVEVVLPRKSVLAKPYSPDEGKIVEDLEQIVVANADQLLIVASWREPFIWPGIIDRYLIAAQRNNICPVICINKIDLIENQVEFDSITKVYRELGYNLILTSAINQTGINALKTILKDKTTVLVGLSGVGKSSLLTAVQPSLNLKTGSVSEHGLFTGQGRHTTTQTNLWKLSNGGVVVDTPGVRAFAIAGINPLDLANWYPEMVPHIKYCRFGNCTHIKEKECGILTAVENGQVSYIRYKNYTQIFDALSV